jgi:hypothetical protein
MLNNYSKFQIMHINNKYLNLSKNTYLKYKITITIKIIYLFNYISKKTKHSFNYNTY